MVRSEKEQRPREGNEQLSDRLQEVKLEDKGLRGVAADYERVKRAFGAGEVERGRGGSQAPGGGGEGAKEGKKEV